ncbi:uncharacterized protein LOC128547144 [Mercenaria mercenaria]|uniref:uncharacterized protein LOC128547144 n=1 Tax=Mercenaria mercenaria TaxID=6596 RepID=UPI00234E63AB|nr:uncharacterized protein LOC128547144 [Mercenaria mercenaria]
MALLVVLKAFVVVISFHLLFNMVMVKCNETSETYCPSRGKAANGKWRLNEKDGLRCILDCDTGYSPNGCHILRQDGYGDWNHNITRCEEESWLNKKKVACFTAIAGIIAASPWIFGALGHCQCKKSVCGASKPGHDRDQLDGVFATDKHRGWSM